VSSFICKICAVRSHSGTEGILLKDSIESELKCTEAVFLLLVLPNRDGESVLLDNTFLLCCLVGTRAFLLNFGRKDEQDQAATAPGREPEAKGRPSDAQVRGCESPVQVSPQTEQYLSG